MLMYTKAPRKSQSHATTSYLPDCLQCNPLLIRVICSVCSHTCHDVHVQSNTWVLRVVYSVFLWPWCCVQVRILYPYCSQLHVLFIGTLTVYRYTYFSHRHVLFSPTRTVLTDTSCSHRHVLFSHTRTVHTILDTLTLCTCCTRCTRFKYIYTFAHSFPQSSQSWINM